MSIAEDPTKGWTLKEAMQKTIDDEKFAKLLPLYSIFLEEKKRSVEVSLKDGVTVPDLNLARWAEIQAKESFVTASNDAWFDLRAQLQKGRPVGFGRPRKADASEVLIEPAQWASFGHYEIATSEVREELAGGARFYATRYFPVAEANATAQLLAGRPLSELGALAILEDVEVQKRLRALGDGEPSQALANQCLRELAKRWPITFGESDLQAALQVFPDADRPAGKKLVQVASIRFASLIEKFRNGRLTASAVARGETHEEAVERSVWRRKDVTLNFLDNQILAGGADRVYCEDVRLAEMEESSAKSASPDGDSERRGPGSPPQYDWMKAYDLMVVKLFDDGWPESGVALRDLVRKCFQEQSLNAPSNDRISDRLKEELPRVWRRTTSKRR